MKQAVIANCRINLGYLKMLTADLEGPQWLNQPAGIVNHPLWQVGHLAVSSRSGCKALGVEMNHADDWPKLFGIGSRPVGDASIYPTPQEAMAAVESGYEQLIGAYEQADDQALAADLPEGRMRELFGTVGVFVSFMLASHFAGHLGQISAWRRAARLPRVL